MTVSNLLAPNISGSSHFYNLAFFICQLFTDGRFQTGHIIFDPNVLSNQMITEIQSNCPRSIPWLTTDVTKPIPSLWQPDQNTDHILQLIFVNPEQLANINDPGGLLLTLYRAFVMCSANQNDVNSRIAMLKKSKMVQRSSLILHYNPLDGSMWIHRSRNNGLFDDDTGVCLIDDAPSTQPREDKSGRCERKNLFDVTFGEHDRTWLITISYTEVHPMKETYDERKLYEIWNGFQFIANLYISNLNAFYINRTEYRVGKAISSVNHQIVRHNYHKFYKELTTDYNEISNETW